MSQTDEIPLQPEAVTVLRPTPRRLVIEVGSATVGMVAVDLVLGYLTRSGLLVALIFVIFVYIATRTVARTRTILRHDSVERIFASGEPRRVPVSDISDVEVVRERWRRIVRLRLIDNSTRLLPVPVWNFLVRNPDFDEQAAVISAWWRDVRPTTDAQAIAEGPGAIGPH